MAALGLNHYNIRAPMEQLVVLRDFYCMAIGLHVGPRPNFRSEGFWLYAGDNAILHLSASRGDETYIVGARSSLDHVAFTCTDLDGTRKHLSGLGISFKEDKVPQTGQRQLFFRDPAGNGVELGFID